MGDITCAEKTLETSQNLEITEINCNIIKQNNRINSLLPARERLSTSDSAVYLENVCKSYGNANPILRNVCMNVKKGTIYGLLGSSGCGKTTMLSCIVGFEKWESGKVVVFGKTPGTPGSGFPGRKLGHMPQEIALYRHLTIREIIHCFGHLYNMGSKEIVDKRNDLFQLLDIPKASTLIRDLSGGQKRRVSLALAMMHSPELLVLDEPTAGVDPLLRKNIWDHLYKLVEKTGVTVLITTHYIEEARHSNTIGIMRNGRLLLENSPSSILNNCKCDLLENAVLQICREDESKLPKMILPNDSHHQLNEIKFKYFLWKEPFKSIKNSSADNDLSLNGKFAKSNNFDMESDLKKLSQPRQLERKSRSYSEINMKQKGWVGSLLHAGQRVYGFSNVIMLTYIRDPIYLLLILLMPTLQGVLCIFAVGSKPYGLHLGIVNHELTNWTEECGLLQNSRNSCQLNFLSCQYINQLRTDDLLVLDSYDNEADALINVKLGRSWGYIIFPENFTASSRDLVEFKQFAQNDSIEGYRICSPLDHSGYVQVSLIMKKLFFSYMSFVKNVADLCQVDFQLKDIPLNFRPPIYGTYEDDFSGYVVPGVVLLSIFGIGIGVTALAHVTDRKEGTLIRARSSGLTASDIIISHFITQMVVTISQLVIWNVMLHFVFNFVNLGSTWLWIVISILVEMTGVACGLLLGQLCGNAVEVLFLIIFLYTIFVFFGCAFIPVERMAGIWQHVAYVLPTFLPTRSARSVVVRGVGLMQPLVWHGLVLSSIWIVVVSAIVFVLIKRSWK